MCVEFSQGDAKLCLSFLILKVVPANICATRLVERIFGETFHFCVSFIVDLSLRLICICISIVM